MQPISAPFFFFFFHMCKAKGKTDAINPKPIYCTATNDPSLPSIDTDSTNPVTESTRPDSSKNSSSLFSTSSSGRSSIRRSLPPNPNIYSYYEISSATNGFVSNRISSSSWRCSLRGADTVIVHRKLRRSIPPPQLHHLLLRICKSHHVAIVRLLGASFSADNVYLVYDHAPGANLADCLRNRRNPNFTVLSTWVSRMQVAADVAQALEYMHHSSGLDLHFVHNRIKSSSIIVTEPSFNAKICFFGAAVLAGEVAGVIEEPETDTVTKLERLDSRALRVEGTTGYMPPESATSRVVSQKTDVFAFGVVMLELISGEEPVRYRYDEERRDRYERVSVIQTATDAVERGRVRRWVDARLKDSFPEDVAERMTRVALDCVHVEPARRPDMRRVAGKISKLYLQSRAWAEQMGTQTDLTVSIAPR